MYRCTNPKCGAIICDNRRGWARSLWRQRIARCPSCNSEVTPNYFVDVNNMINKEKEDDKRA